MAMHGRGNAAGTGEEPVAAHAVFFPFPAQGHITPALHLANLLHVRAGVRVTFVHTERSRRRLLRAGGPDALIGTPGFGYAFVPDGLPPPSDEDVDDDHSPERMAALLTSIGSSVPHLKKVLDAAAESRSPVTCVVSDIKSVLRATRQMGFPTLAFWTASACGLLSLLLCQQLIDRGLVPLKDAEQLSNGYLDRTVIDWAPGLPADMRLRDFVSFIRTTDPNDGLLRETLDLTVCLRTTPSALVLNTFDELDAEVLGAMSIILPPIYTVGPLPQLAERALASGSPLATLGVNLSNEDDACLAWLGRRRRPHSVVYASFGSIAVLTSQQLREFAWGLADSGYDFLLVTRKDQAKDAGGPAAVLTPEFAAETKDRGYMTSWCPQGKVLRHEAVGAFLTHCGWNSVLEGICSGVPLLCWPFAADQQPNCRFACTEWRIGVEIDADVNRGQVAELVREVMGRERGREMRRRATEWKERAAAAALPGGPSWVNLERLIKQVFPKRKEASQ